jgi:hypothetical protein
VAGRRPVCHAGRPATLAPPVAYGLLDGLFQQARSNTSAGARRGAAHPVDQVHAVLPLMLER